MQLVIVESPAKAKTIEKYLGKDFKVLASYGHIRDLPPKDGSVRPDEDFAMDWEIYSDQRKRSQVKAIADAVSIPQILYNVPGRTGVDMQNDTTLRLSEIDNIVAIKDATNDLDRGRDLIRRAPQDFLIYSGEDGTACELMIAGGKGTISVTANAAPNLMHRMCQAAIAGDADSARALNNQLADLHKAMFVESNPIPAKWAVSQQGLIGGGIRLPLLPLSLNCQDEVRSAMSGAGVL